MDETPRPQSMFREFTIRKYAARHDVTPTTVRRWIAKGAVEVRRTPGGQIRILEREPATSLSSTHS